LRKTEMVDCESNRMESGSMPMSHDWASMKAYWVSVVPVVVGVLFGAPVHISE
jgi:hypothetical protein